MSNSTFIPVPQDLTDLQSLRRFLEKLVIELDRAYGNRSTSPFASADISAELLAINNSIEAINIALSNLAASEVEYLKKDGSRDATGILSYVDGLVISADHHIVDKKYVTDNFTNNPIQSAIADLSQTLVSPGVAYVQSEAQLVATNCKETADKVDSLLSALRSSNLINI